MEDLAEKVYCFILRMEQVVLSAGVNSMPTSFTPVEFLCPAKMKNFFATHPRVWWQWAVVSDAPCVDVPVWHTEGTPCGFGGLSGQLEVFQYELALEEVFYGPSSINANSVSYQRGFIGLTPCNSASAEERPPPDHHQNHDPIQVSITYWEDLPPLWHLQQSRAVS